MITSNVLKHLERYDILTDCQHGFRAKRSCETELLTLAQELLAGLDKKHQHDLIILYFSKAFDRVPHQRLMRKLAHYGTRGITYNWIEAFLTDRTHQVLVEGVISDSIPVISRVPQRTVLGPLLFLLFINDLPDCVQLRTRIFADDCILCRQIKTHQDCAILQEDLHKLAAWEQKWGMAFHPDKCNIIKVSSRNPITIYYTLQGLTWTTEDYTMYLGVDLQSTFSWIRHIDQTVIKANSMVGFLRRNLRVSSEATNASAYYSMVRPLFTVRVFVYCLESLYQGMSQTDNITQVV